MRIGVSDLYLDALGGGERYMLTIASCLSTLHTVSVFWDDTSILEKAAKRFSLDLSHVTTTPNIFSLNIPTATRLKETKKFDAIIYLSDGSIPVSLAKKNILHFQHPITWVKPSIITKLKLKKVNVVIVNSSYTKSYIDPVFNVKSTVLYPPCENIGISNQQEKKNIILTVGRYNKLGEHNDFKKLENMIAVFKKLYNQGVKGYRFILVVTHKEKDKGEVSRLQEQSKGYPIDLLTDTSHEKLVSLYQTAKIYWHAAGFEENIKEHPERAEHFGISTVEAMSAGAVPVVIHAGGLPEIVIDGENGYLWNTEEELLEKTKELIENTPKREKIASAGIKRAKMFTQDMFCSSINRIVS